MARLFLHTESLSRTTVRYTVSSAPARNTVAGRVLNNLCLTLRLVAAALCFLVSVLRIKEALRFDALSSYVLWAQVEHHLQQTIDGWCGGADFAASGTRWLVLPLMCMLMGLALVRRYYVEESLLVIRGLGVQTSTSAATLLGSPTIRFIATSQIQDIFIHEAFIGFEVRFYLAVIVEGEQAAVVVFPKSLPRREILEQVWRGTRDVLGWAGKVRSSG